MKTDFIIIEPIELPEMLERNYTVCKPLIAQKATVFVDKVLEQGDPLRVAENLAAIQLFVKNVEADDRLNEYVLNVLDHNAGKVETKDGTKVERVEAGAKYDYSKCGDPVLQDLYRKLDDIKRQVKHREQFVQAAPAAGCEIIVDGGEVVTIYPPTKTSISTYKVTLSAKEIEPSIPDLPF
jgi:hypothetical protein